MKKCEHCGQVIKGRGVRLATDHSRAFCSRKCLTVGRGARLSVSDPAPSAPPTITREVVSADDSACVKTAKQSKNAAAAAKANQQPTTVDRWAAGFERLRIEREERERELALATEQDRLDILANKSEREEMERLERRYFSGMYTTQQLERLRELRQKHKL